MGSLLGPVIANIFMVELERSIIPQLEGTVALWYRYVDDTFTIIRKDCVEAVLESLNGFHRNIEFTFEKEANGSISFLDVSVIRKLDGAFDTDIHRKSTDTNVYINWEAFAPKSWKRGTLKGLIRRAFTICSTKEFRDKEISHIKKVFGEQNGYPSRVIHECIHEVQRKIERDWNIPGNPQEEGNLSEGGILGAQDVDVSEVCPTEDRGGPRIQPEERNPSKSAGLGVSDATVVAIKEIKPVICLPFKGKEGDKLISQFRNALAKVLPPEIKPRFT